KRDRCASRAAAGVCRPHGAAGAAHPAGERCASGQGVRARECACRHRRRRRMSARVTTLESGMRVLTDPTDSVETVSLGVWVDVGTRHEPAPINGVAHLLEHMAFKGTERRSALDIAAEIEAVGGHLNAYTSREHTAYYAKVLKEDVELAVD